MKTADAVDPCRCPLCGGPNRCAMVEPEPMPSEHKPCWCSGAQFSTPLLQQLAELARAKSCICPDCVKASQVQT